MNTNPNLNQPSNLKGDKLLFKTFSMKLAWIIYQKTFKIWSKWLLKQHNKPWNNQTTSQQYAMKCTKRFKLRRNYLMKLEKRSIYSSMKSEKRLSWSLSKNLKTLSCKNLMTISSKLFDWRRWFKENNELGKNLISWSLRLTKFDRMLRRFKKRKMGRKMGQRN